MVIDIQQRNEDLGQAVPALHVLRLHIEVVSGSGLSIQAGPGLGVDDPRGWVDQEAAGHRKCRQGCVEARTCTHMCTHVPSARSRLREGAAMHWAASLSISPAPLHILTV